MVGVGHVLTGYDCYRERCGASTVGIRLVETYPVLIHTTNPPFFVRQYRVLTKHTKRNDKFSSSSHYKSTFFVRQYHVLTKHIKKHSSFLAAAVFVVMTNVWYV